MPIQGSGEIKFSQIASQFGRSLANGVSMKLFYRGGGVVPDISENSNVPNSGEIKFSRFFAAQSGVGDGTFVYRDIRFDANGWAITGQFLAETSRIVYISNTGNDTLAANNQHGRGYYLYNDDEIGADPTQPIGEVYAYQTLTAAYTAARYFGSISINQTNPDWLLFKRGDSFDFSGFQTQSLLGATMKGGTAPNARRVFAAYGNLNLPRPKIIYFASSTMQEASNFAFISLHMEAHPNWTSANYPNSIHTSVRSLGPVSNIYLEDMLGDDIGGFQNFGVLGGPENLFIRRCIGLDGWHVKFKGGQGLYVSGATGKTTISECLIDNCSYHEDPKKPSTWTGATKIDQRASKIPNLPIGQGVQPLRSFFDRNCYLSSANDLLFENNIVARGGGGGSVQMRTGGVARGNLFIWNHTAVAGGGQEADRYKSKNFLVENNLVLHDDHFAPDGAHGGGIGLGAAALNSVNSASAISNIVLHFHETGAGALSASFIPYGNASYTNNAGEFVPEAILGLGRISGNTSVQLHSATNVGINTLVTNVQVGNNEFLLADTSNAAFYNADVTQAGVRANSNFEIGNSVTGGNFYYAPNWTSFSTTWQGAGKDTASTRYNTIQEMVTARGWNQNAVNEDIITYMQSLDPSYVPNEEMTVDDQVQIDPADRRPTAPKLWYVLRNPTLFQGNGFTINASPTDAQAKLTARRTHAFHYFMSFARQNRKGNWNLDYTAKNVNNYFRALYNKSLV